MKKGSTCSPQHIEKNRQTSLKRWANPDYKAKMLPHLRKAAKLSGGFRGNHSPESRKKMSEIHKARFRMNPDLRMKSAEIGRKNWLKYHRLPRTISPTKIEILIEEVLKQAGIDYSSQQPFRLDNQTVVPDFYLPEYGIVIECDGEYWHSLPCVKRRDHFKNQLYKSLGLRVVRLKEHSILSDPVQALLNGVGKPSD